MLHFEF